MFKNPHFLWPRSNKRSLSLTPFTLWAASIITYCVWWGHNTPFQVWGPKFNAGFCAKLWLDSANAKIKFKGNFAMSSIRRTIIFSLRICMKPVTITFYQATAEEKELFHQFNTSQRSPMNLILATVRFYNASEKKKINSETHWTWLTSLISFQCHSDCILLWERDKQAKPRAKPSIMILSTSIYEHYNIYILQFS